ncbi:stabilizer of axonemal microtubules 1-like [Tupaia chinensis]|uniref:stabilizer of axonemal microtubules 1-like n=1 Tax=Tupaia chinensis TaxID=246437 RepID=UPI000703C95C|nr:stabilizer of axonemal microtubules 1-like [Tupaia chinensis]
MAPVKKCICDLCSCGRHHCPHLPTKIYDKTERPCLLSEYTENYPVYCSYLPRESFKPKMEYQKGSIPMEGLTTSSQLPKDGQNKQPQKKQACESSMMLDL